MLKLSSRRLRTIQYDPKAAQVPDKIQSALCNNCGFIQSQSADPSVPLMASLKTSTLQQQFMEKRETTIVNLVLQFLDPKCVTFKNLKCDYFVVFLFLFFLLDYNNES